MAPASRPQVLPTIFEGALLVEPSFFPDQRGILEEAYVQSKYCRLGIGDVFVQDNVVLSVRGTLRGLHADPRMAKLVHVLRGQVFDVIVDARRNSPTFGRWQGFDLTDQNHTQIFIPAEFLHGYFVLSEDAIVSYKQTAEYDPGREAGVIWNDPVLGIAWPAAGPPLLSAKDRANRSFIDVFGER
jgi:dTDP-4-dehydrorhamnose 3,5-epimerase